MTKLLALFAFALTAAAANARLSTWQMTCAQATNVVAENGEVVMNYAYSDKAGYLYERFVSGSNFCDGYERARPMWVKTKDNPECALNVCREVADDQAAL